MDFLFLLLFVELAFETRDLVLKTSDDFCVLGDVVLDVVDILDGFVLDLLGPVGVFESVVGVLVAVAVGRDVGDHDCSAVSTQ